MELHGRDCAAIGIKWCIEDRMRAGVSRRVGRGERKYRGSGLLVCRS